MPRSKSDFTEIRPSGRELLPRKTAEAVVKVNDSIRELEASLKGLDKYDLEDVRYDIQNMRYFLDDLLSLISSKTGSKPPETHKSTTFISVRPVKVRNKYYGPYAYLRRSRDGKYLKCLGRVSNAVGTYYSVAALEFKGDEK